MMSFVCIYFCWSLLLCTMFGFQCLCAVVFSILRSMYCSAVAALPSSKGCGHVKSTRSYQIEMSHHHNQEMMCHT